MGVYSELRRSFVFEHDHGTEPRSMWLAGAMERVLAALLILVTLPAAVVVAAIIVLLSHLSPLVAHLRIGQFGRPFWMWKFRTMWDRRQPARPLVWMEEIQTGEIQWRKGAPDPRITSRFARFCRKYSLDELPQLWHVPCGPMALVGPRPLTVSELAEHYGPAASIVLQAKPGLTGLWQVTGRNSLTYRQRRRLDLFFVRHGTIRLRSRILWRTIAVVLSGKDAL